MTNRTHPDGDGGTTKHEEWLLDEALRGSFPASDPASSSQPGSIVNRRYAARPGTRIGAVVLAVSLALPAAHALAQDKAAYNERSIARVNQMFAAYTRDGSDRVARAAVTGDIDFIAAFDDIDINRDQVVTRAELDRYLALHYGASATR